MAKISLNKVIREMNRRGISFADSFAIRDRKLAEFADKVLKARTLIMQARKALSDTAKEQAKAQSDPRLANVFHVNFKRLGMIQDKLNETIQDIEAKVR